MEEELTLNQKENIAAIATSVDNNLGDMISTGIIGNNGSNLATSNGKTKTSKTANVSTYVELYAPR